MLWFYKLQMFKRIKYAYHLYSVHEINKKELNEYFKMI